MISRTPSLVGIGSDATSVIYILVYATKGE